MGKRVIVATTALLAGLFLQHMVLSSMRKQHDYMHGVLQDRSEMVAEYHLLESQRREDGGTN